MIVAKRQHRAFRKPNGTLPFLFCSKIHLPAINVSSYNPTLWLPRCLHCNHETASVENVEHRHNLNVHSPASHANLVFRNAGHRLALDPYIRPQRSPICERHVTQRQLDGGAQREWLFSQPLMLDQFAEDAVGHAHAF